jgi:MFS family permease
MPIRRAATAAIVVLLGVNILNYYDRQAPGALAEPIRREFGLSDTQLGLLGSALTWVYALAGLPIGLLGDRWSRRKLLAAGVALWSALTAVGAIANSFGLLLISRLGVGIGEAVAAPTGTSWIGDLFPPDQRSRALSVFMLGVPAGTALSFFSSGPIAVVWGWRVALAVAAAPALVLIPAILLLPEPERGAAEPVPFAAHDRSLRRILRIPAFWWIVASGTMFTFNMYAIGFFMPAFLGRIHHLAVSRTGVALGVCQVIGGMGGAWIAGKWGDKVTAGHRRMRLAAIITLSGAPASAVTFLLPAGWLLTALVFFVCAYGALNAYYGLVFSALQDIVPPSLRATAMAVYLMLMYLCGASFGPLLTGHLSDRFARRAAEAAGSVILTEANRAAGLQSAMLIVPILSVALAITLWAGAKTMEQNQNA